MNIQFLIGTTQHPNFTITCSNASLNSFIWEFIQKQTSTPPTNHYNTVWQSDHKCPSGKLIVSVHFESWREVIVQLVLVSGSSGVSDSFCKLDGKKIRVCKGYLVSSNRSHSGKTRGHVLHLYEHLLALFTIPMSFIRFGSFLWWVICGLASVRGWLGNASRTINTIGARDGWFLF